MINLLLSLKPKAGLILAGTTLAIASFSSVYIQQPPSPSPTAVPFLGLTDTQKYHLAKPPDLELLLFSLQANGKSQTGFKQSVAGAIVPHHLLAGDYIARLIGQLNPQQIQTVILIGPNHQELGDFPVLTSQYHWKTPFGFLRPNLSLINQLQSTNSVHLDEAVLAQEHAITGILPAISYYLPDASIVPLVVSGKLTRLQTEKLARDLQESINEQTVIIASVDFSHYLKVGDAMKNDKYTLKLLKNLDYSGFFGLNSDYLDSPPTIALLLMLMQATGHTTAQLLEHSNSAILLRDKAISTTSYITTFFY